MPSKRTTPKGYERARQLRKELTPAKHKLRAYLRGNKFHGISYWKHSVILNGCRE